MCGVQYLYYISSLPKLSTSREVLNLLDFDPFFCTFYDYDNVGNLIAVVDVTIKCGSKKINVTIDLILVKLF